MRLIIFTILLSLTTPINADIFKCSKADGSIYYYEYNCLASDKQLDITKRDLVLMRYELQQKHQDLIQQKKHLLRQEFIAEKQRVAEQRQRLRAQSKCSAINLQIEQLNKRYKQGYTVKQGQALKRKLAECNNQRRIYCNP